MALRLFLAGATGAVGARLVPLLLEAGHHVVGLTRSAEKAAAWRARGIEMAVVDVFDGAALRQSAIAARPDVVIHQLTDLPVGLDPARMAEALVRNARIRDVGTLHVVDAARAAGARRIVAQSIAWAYAAGPEPHAEADPLDVDATGIRGTSVQGVIALERQVLGSAPMDGVVLRYGRFYGPGTGVERAAEPCVHVDAAARAALLAIDRGAPGAYNIAEPNGLVATAKARAELGWDAGFRAMA